MTLTGTVSEESHKTLAHETAAGLPGVARVDNQLATQAEAAAENADTWIGPPSRPMPSSYPAWAIFDTSTPAVWSGVVRKATSARKLLAPMSSVWRCAPS